MKNLITLVLCSLIISCSKYTAQFTANQAVIVNKSSGFKIDRFIVTANHVADSPFCTIEDINHKEYIAVVVARDTLNDIALLQAKEDEFYDYSIATPNTREWVYSISNPAELNFSECTGDIQNVSRTDEGVTYIQVGIDVFWGSSGSAIFNTHGQLLGMLVKAIPGTRFAFVIPIGKIVLLIHKQQR